MWSTQVPPLGAAHKIGCMCMVYLCLWCVCAFLCGMFYKLSHTQVMFAVAADGCNINLAICMDLLPMYDILWLLAIAQQKIIMHAGNNAHCSLQPPPESCDSHSAT